MNTAFRFADSVGICVHPNWLSTEQWKNPAWPDALIATGVKHARGTIGRNKAVLPYIKKLTDAGVKLCAMVVPGKNIETTAYAGIKADIDFLVANVGVQHLSGIESANEYNKDHVTGWATKLRTFQAWLHSTVRANARLNGIPVIAPSMYGRLTQDYIALGNLEPNVEAGCVHFYPGPRRPTRASPLGGKEYGIADAFREARVLAPHCPLWVTEYGYDPKDPGTLYLVPQSVAAKYLLRGLFDSFTNGADRTYIYELLDDPGTGHEWGLTTATLQPKATYTALKNLMALVNDTETEARPLDYALTGATADVRQVLLTRSDGSHLLVLYRDVDSYDRKTFKPLAVAPVKVALTCKAASFKVYQPTFDASCKQVGSGTIVIPVGDEVTIVRISGAAVTQPVPDVEVVPEPARCPTCGQLLP